MDDGECCVITPTGWSGHLHSGGFTSAGLPVGLQLVAPVGQERRLLEIASAMESAELAARVPQIPA